MRWRRLGWCATVLASAVACGPPRVPPELTDARAAFARAQAGPPAEIAPDAMAEARRALVIAERAQDEAPGSDEARSLAYVAHRKTLTAEASARRVLAEAEEARARDASTTAERDERAAGGGGRMLTDKAAVDERTGAERRAKEALGRLAPLAAVREEARGVVVRLAGSSLFEGETAELMPTGRERLDRVAEALRQLQAPTIAVRGHVDRSGDDRHDVELSTRRANTVRAYLVSRGVEPDRVRADGVGSAEPIASNASPAGRSDNRRIEIVVHGDGEGADR